MLYLCADGEAGGVKRRCKNNHFFATMSPREVKMSMASETWHDILPPGQGSVLWVSAPASDYLASRLAMAVEDADASLMGLRVASDGPGRMLVRLRTSAPDPTPVARSLERYGYRVTRASGSAYAEADKSRESLENLRRYLEI